MLIALNVENEMRESAIIHYENAHLMYTINE